MTEGTGTENIQDVTPVTNEVSEAREQLDRASTDPEAAVEKTSDFKEAEALEKEVVAAVEAAPRIETPPAITLEGAGAEGKVTITEAAEADGPKTEDRAAIIDTNDREVEVVETTTDGGRTIEDRVEVAADESVMIDTVPLPEKPATTAVSRSQESIGTWPTPENPELIIDSNDLEVIIDTNDEGGKVSSGANLDDVLIIGPNDGTSTVGIIDTNDMPAPEAIIESNDREASFGAEDESSVGGGSASAAVESDVQGETNQNGRVFKFEIKGDKPGVGEFNRQDVSATYVHVGDGSTTTADDTGPLAKVEAGVIATAEADVSTAKTIGTEASQGSGIPIDEGGDTADGASPGRMEVGSVEEAEQIMPETGEPTLTDSGNEGSDLPQSPNINDYMVPKTDADGNPVLDADGNPILVPDMDAYSAAYEEYVALLTGEEPQEVGQETLDATDEIQAKIDELRNKMSDLGTMMQDQTIRLNQLYALREHINVTSWGGTDPIIIDPIPIITYEKQDDGSYLRVEHFSQLDQDKTALPGNINLVLMNRASLMDDYVEISIEIQDLTINLALQKMEDQINSTDE